MSDVPTNSDAQPSESNDAGAAQQAATQPQKRTGLAAAAFACSLVGLGGLVPEHAVTIPVLNVSFGGYGPSHAPGLIFTIGGFLFGVAALVLARRHPDRYGRTGLAGVGMVLGLLGTSGIFAEMVFFDWPESRRIQTIYDKQICARNMKMLGNAFRNAARDYGGLYPPRIDTLVTTEKTRNEYCLCPGSDVTPDELRENIEACYIYIKGQGPGNDPNNVLFYEPTESHDGRGCNVYFNDGRLEFIEPYSRVEELVAATRQRLAKHGPLTTRPTTQP